MAANSKQIEIDNALTSGGVIYVSGVKVFIDNPNNYDVFAPATGYWITNAQGWKTYFKSQNRADAQKACNDLFGAGRYTVNTKV